MDTQPQPPAAHATPAQRLAFGPFVLDAQGAQLLRDGVAVEITPKTLAVLQMLTSRPGQLITKDELLDAVWGHRFVSDSALKVAINNLRAVLGEDAREPQWVHTVQRRGYRFASEVQPLTPAAAEATSAPLQRDPVGASGATTGPGGHAHRSAAAPSVPGNLPRQHTALLGRADDLARTHSAMAGHRIVTITGPGGVGKTRLALASAAHRPPPDGVWLLRLDALGAQDSVAPALARLLGLPDSAGADTHSLARSLAPLRVRLVLDNAEHMADTLAPQLSAWLQQAPGLQLLVTSQRPLHVADEQVLPLAPLALPAASEGLDVIRNSPAVALLCLRIETAQPGWAAQDADWNDLAEIARGLEGMPLALELAAARVPLLGADGVRKRLGEQLRMLTRGPADAPGRQKTLRTALEWSVGLLPPPAAALLEVCAVFVGGFTLDAVQAVAASVLRELDEWDLIDHLELLRETALIVDAGTPPSPLVPTRGSAQAEFITLDWFAAPRLRMYDSVRLLGLERLAARGAAQATYSAHIAWLRVLFNEADQVQLDLAEAVWLGKLDPEAGNLLAGITRAMQAVQEPAGAGAAVALEHAVDLLTASTPYALRSGLRLQAQGWWLELQAQLAAAADTQATPPRSATPPCSATPPGSATPLPPLLTARLSLMTAMLASQSLVKLSDGIEAARRAAPVLRAHGEQRRLLLALYLGALMQLNETGVEDAERGVAEMRELVGPNATVYERRLVPWAEAMMARRRGDLDTYGRFFADMLAVSERRGDRLEAWKAGWGAAQALVLTGHTEQAIKTFDRTLDDLRSAGRLRTNPLLVGQAACVRLLHDASPQTLRLAQEAVQLLRPGAQISLSMGDALPWAAWWQGRVQDALRLHAWSEEVAQTRSERRGPVNDHVRAALLLQFNGQPVPASSGLDDEAAVQLALGPC